jgi:hypothetical protein
VIELAGLPQGVMHFEKVGEHTINTPEKFRSAADKAGNSRKWK